MLRGGKYEKNSKIIMITLSIIMSIILAISQFIFDTNSDMIGYSSAITTFTHITELLVNVVVPVVVVFTMIFKKDRLTVLLLIFRCAIRCINVALVYTEDGCLTKMNIMFFVSSIIYIVAICLLLLRKLAHKKVIFTVIISRLLVLLFSVDASNIMYGFRHGGMYFMFNLVYTIATEFIFIIPIIYRNNVKCTQQNCEKN